MHLQGTRNTWAVQERPWSEDQEAKSSWKQQALPPHPCLVHLARAFGPIASLRPSSKDGPSSSEAMKLLADQGAASFDKVAECYSGPEQRLGENGSCFA